MQGADPRAVIEVARRAGREIDVNEIELAIQEQGLDGNSVLDALQDAGVISDLCLSPADIALLDIPRALDILVMGVETGEIL